MAYANADSGDVIFQETFDTEDDFNTWTIVDNNGGRTWEFLNGAAAYMLDYQTGLPGDDWYISPSFTLDESKVYKLEYTVRFNSRTENLRVLLGTSEEPSSFTTVLADYPGATNADNGDKEIKLLVKASGEFRLAFYAYSEANMHRIDVDNVKITEVSDVNVPGAIGNLSLTPGDKGALSATLSFTAPSVTAGDAELTENMMINIYRNGDTSCAKSFDNVAPGAELTWTDEEPIHGINTYTLEASNSYGAGESSTVSAYIGADVPKPVNDLKAKLNSERGVTLTWTAPTESANGGYVDFSSITYNIYRGDVKIADNVSETEYNDNVPVESGQAEVYYNVEPVSGESVGEMATSGSVVTGEPMSLPYKESFANQSVESPWSQDSDVYGFDWQYMPDDEEGEYEEIMSQDSDNGILRAESKYADYGSQSRYISPLLDLSTANNPVLTFWFYYARSTWYDPDYDGEINDNVKVQISFDAGEWEDVENSTFYINESSAGWTKCTVSLPKQTGNFVNLAFLATAESDAGAYRNIYIDNISVDESEYSNDLALDEFTVDNKRVSVGETAKYSVTVFNRGASSVSDYSINLYRDGELEATLAGVAIEPAAKQTIEHESLATLDDAQAESHIWEAEIVFASDELAENNVSSELETSVRKPEVPSVNNLTGSVIESGISLSWDAASSVAPVEYGDFQTVTDDFEDYTPFIIDNIGEWTVYDGDKASTLSSPRIPNSYDHRGDPMAFQVFNNIDAGTWVEDNYDQPFEAHSGNQYLLCPSTNYPDENDDWLITPRLDGRAQTISFYAHSATYDAEWMSIWYSTTDNHHDSFIKLSEDDHISVYEPWLEYSFDVPEGTRYVAVRCVRRCVFLFIDDFTYNRYDGATDGYTLVGYNVYRDGEKINSEPIDTNSYSDAGVSTGTIHTYKVTAVYSEGESDYSNEIEIGTTGIESGVNNTVNVDETARYDVSGRKINVPSRGVNIVKTSDGKVRKVMVK